MLERRAARGRVRDVSGVVGLRPGVVRRDGVGPAPGGRDVADERPVEMWPPGVQRMPEPMKGLPKTCLLSSTKASRCWISACSMPRPTGSSNGPPRARMPSRSDLSSFSLSQWSSMWGMMMGAFSPASAPSLCRKPCASACSAARCVPWESAMMRDVPSRRGGPSECWYAECTMRKESLTTW